MLLVGSGDDAADVDDGDDDDDVYQYDVDVMAKSVNQSAMERPPFVKRWFGISTLESQYHQTILDQLKATVISGLFQVGGCALYKPG